MFRHAIPATLVALFLSSASFANPDDKVMDIRIDVGLPAVADADAAGRSARIGDDLKAAIAERLSGRIADKGIRIEIDVTQLVLDAGAGEDGKARLAGKVHFNDDYDNSKIRAFALEVSQGPSALVVPVTEPAEAEPVAHVVAVQQVNPDMVYGSLVSGFADAVVDHLNQ